MGDNKKPWGIKHKLVAAADAAVCAAGNITAGKSGTPGSLLRWLYGRCLKQSFIEEEHEFGGTRFYQSYAPLYLLGNRPTDFRIAEYVLDEFLSKDKDVLDVGCNCGFFALTVAPKVKTVTGLEYDPYYLTYAQKAARFMGITNASFISGDFKEYKTGKQFDLIFSFAVHKWIGLPLDEYFSRLCNLLRPGGILLFESHGLQRYDKEIDSHVTGAIGGLFEIVRDGILYDGFKTKDTSRKYWYLKKT